MTSYRQQIETTQAAHMAARALSDAALVKLEDLWNQFESGSITVTQYQTAVVRSVRFSYRESAFVARSLTQQLSGIDKWNPGKPLRNSPYLMSLIADVKKNFKAFKDSDQLESDTRRLKLRISLSATTGAQRGFTDAQNEFYGELQDLGKKLKKVWLANFVNNEPCSNCIKLHGVKVDFNKEFPVPTLMKTAVYRDLMGPPLHVNCKCVMVVLISTAANLFDTAPIEVVKSTNTMTTDSVKKLPKVIFDAIIKVLRLITGGGRK